MTDADLPRCWYELRATALLLALPRATTGKTLGRTFPDLVRRMAEQVASLNGVAREVVRFAPPPELADEALKVMELANHGRSFVDGVRGCVARGWDASRWAIARTHCMDADAAAAALTAPGASDPHNVAGDKAGTAWTQVLGVPVNQLSSRRGYTFAATLLTVWAQDPDGFDDRLRRQSRHLLDDSVPLTHQLRRHLTSLAICDRPLFMHRAAAASRDLISASLASDPTRTRATIAGHVEHEAGGLATHHGLYSAAESLQHASSMEEWLASACRAYLVMVEGDLKRTASLVLELMGVAVPEKPGLTAIRELTCREQSDSLCQMIASVIHTDWRHAIAHERYHWDPLREVAVLTDADTTIAPDEILRAARRARSVCRGFELGVALAYTANRPVLIAGSDPRSEVTRNFDILEACAAAGQQVLNIRRAGTTIELDVPDIDISSLRTLAAALICASQADEGVKRWVARQESDRPDLCVNRAAVESALELTGRDMSSLGDAIPAASLPVLADALEDAGTPLETTVSAIQALAAAHVVGERDRLLHRLKAGEAVAGEELLKALILVSQGIEHTAIHARSDASRQCLLALAALLTSVVERSAGSSPISLIKAISPIDLVLRSNAPVTLPWIAVHSAS